MAVIACLLAATLASSSARASTTQLLVDPLTGANLLAPSLWTDGGTVPACLTAGTSLGQSPVAGCNLATPDAVGSGALRLPPKLAVLPTFDVDADVQYTPTFSASDGLKVAFDESSWGNGNGGADGMSMFLTDGSQPAGLAAAGLHYYGYMPVTSGAAFPGVENGLMAVVVDTVGNAAASGSDGKTFTDSNGSHSCTGAPGARTQSVEMRGAGNGQYGYCMVAITAANAYAIGRPTRAAATHHIVVTVSPSTDSNPRVTVTVDGTTIIDVAVSATAPSWYPGATLATVSSYRLGFGGSTAGLWDLHDIWNLHVDSIVSHPPVLAVGASGGPLRTGGTGVVNLSASLGGGGGLENTPVTLAAALPAGMTVAAVPTSSGWDCGATVVGSSAIQCSHAASEPR